MTRSPLRLESLLMRLSEMPSLRYSIAESPVAFSNGRTATSRLPFRTAAAAGASALSGAALKR